MERSDFDFKEILELEQAWKPIGPKVQPPAKGLSVEAFQSELDGQGVSARQALGQHAPEDMLMSGMRLFNAEMQHDMGFYERGRVFEQLGLSGHALSAFQASQESGEAFRLIQSCDRVSGEKLEPFSAYYKGLVYLAIGQGEQALLHFDVAHGHEVLGNRPEVKRILLPYLMGRFALGEQNLEEALSAGKLSQDLLRMFVGRFLQLGIGQPDLGRFMQICALNGYPIQF